MKNYLLLLMLLPVFVIAQEKENAIVNIGSGDQFSEKVAENVQYVLPEFKGGVVYFRNGQRSSSQLNYNVYLGEMHFKDKDEVLAFMDLSDIILVVIDSRRFLPFNDKEFCEEVLANDKARLCLRRYGNISEYSKMGAYGMTSSTSSIKSYSSMYGSNNNRTDLKFLGEVKLTVNNMYYFMSDKGKFTQIRNVKNVTKQFPGNNAKIDAFVKENKTDFKKTEDLKALLEYCFTL